MVEAVQRRVVKAVANLRIRTPGYTEGETKKRGLVNLHKFTLSYRWEAHQWRGK